MTENALLIQVLIAISAGIYGLVVGRARAARMRELRRNVQAGITSAWVIVGLVVAVSISAMVARAPFSP